MQGLEFDFPWDNGRRVCTLVDVAQGAGGYHILIDNYYKGNIRKIDGQWVGFLNNWKELCLDDIQFLGGLIDEATSYSQEE